MYRLVVIDDEYLVVEGIRAMIARMNLQFTVVGYAYDGIKGLEIVQREMPDLVITDIRIPGMDGLSLIETARETCPDTLFVVISGYTEFEYARRALYLGVKDYIDKPISMARLKDVLTRMENQYLKVRDQQREEEMRRDGYIRLEELLKSGMKDITEGDGARLASDSEEIWQLLEMMYPELSDIKRECYKILSVFGDILADQQKKVRRDELVDFRGLNAIGSLDSLATYYQNAISMISRYLVHTQTGTSHRIVLKLLDYINRHYNEDIGLNELADMVDMNAAYLSVLFKEEVGQSYVKYLTDLRLREAKKLLTEGYMVSEVSAMVGYSNYRYFSDIFKKHEGVTPNEYKGSRRKDEAAEAKEEN